MHVRFLAPAVLALAASTSAVSRTAEKADNASSKALDAVLACKGMTDQTQRLACYDSSVASLQIATTQQDIIVVDRNEMREARHSLFGFNLPNLAIFGSEKGKAGPIGQEEKEISATVGSARIDGAGAWIIILDSGPVWHQTDDVAVGYTPRPGMPLTIKRGALGSYFMRINNRVGFKVKRDS